MLNRIKNLIPRSLNDSYIGRDNFLLVNDVLKNYHDFKHKIKNLKA